MKVRDHRGQAWRVTRRWVPWRRRIRGFWDLMPIRPSSGGMDDSGIFGVVVAVIFVVLAVPFLVFLALAVVELLLLLLLFPFLILGRMLFGQHWTVEARRGFSPWFEVRAGSWTDSGQRIRDIAAAIERGELPPPNLERRPVLD